MKTLQQIAKILTLVLVLLAAGCKKDKQDSLPVHPDDLLAYRFVGTFIDNNKVERLRLFYFNKKENTIECTTDYITTRRIQTVALVNNSFTIDMDGDGKVVYTFNLGKRDDGSVFIRSSKYQNTTAPTYISWQCEAHKASDIVSVKNIHFVGSNEYNISFKTDTWFFAKTPAVTGSFYEVFPGAWKGTLNGVYYFGIRLKTKEDSKMVFQKNGETNMITLYQD